MSKINQILKNTEAIMDHLGIHDKQIADHDARIKELEQRLREKAIPGCGRTMVLSSDAHEIADEENMTAHELYRMLRSAGLIVPGDEEHTTKTQRINGDLVRVLLLKRR